MRHRTGKILIAISLLFARNLGAQQVLIPAGATWKYLDDGSDQGTRWRAPGFNDADWKVGSAQLGYGDGDEATTVGYGSESRHKNVTTYFRHSFSVGYPRQVPHMQAMLLRDDGAVVYLNGTEIMRSNMPSGDIDYLTLASGSVGGDGESDFNESIVSSAPFVPGNNVLAVEIHQSSRSSSDMSFDLELRALTNAPVSLRKLPYLIYAGVNTEMELLWQLQATNTCTVEWGQDTTYSAGSAQTREFGDDHQHAYTFSDLVPGAKYYYRVISGDGEYRGDFRAAPPADATSLKFLLYGDTRSHPQEHNKVAAAMLRELTEDEDYQSMVIMTGDLVGNGNRESDWDTQFFDPDYSDIRRLLAREPLQACMGNHEKSGELFMKYFPFPFVDRRYWSFDYGPAHFVCLDQYTSYTPGTEQLAWLENDLATTDKPWKIIYLHEPGWSAGGGHGNQTKVQDYIQPLCEEYGVNLVLAGHNHYYSRAQVNGVQHITSGGGGTKLHTPNPDFPNVVTASKSKHYCKIALEHESLELTVLEPNGTVIDHYYSAKSPLAVERPAKRRTPAPRGLALHPAYPNAFNPTTTLSFTIPEKTRVMLTVYDVRGRRVKTLESGRLKAGAHSYVWDATDDKGVSVPSGVYIYELSTPDYVTSNRVTLVR